MSDIYNKKLIVIDDSDFAKAALFSMLRKLGYQNIDLPGDSPEALELITQKLLSGEPYDLVITDLNMPDLDGMELIEKIKGDPIGEKQKIMVVTADADPIIEKVTMDLGACAYLTKPTNKELLDKTLKEIFEFKSEDDSKAKSYI